MFKTFIYISRCIYKNYDKIAPIDDHLAKLFKYGPNPRQSMFSFMQYMESTRNTSHGAYAIIEYDKNMNVKDLEKAINNAKHHMEEAAKKLDFMEAAQWRDEMIRLEAIFNEKNN